MSRLKPYRYTPTFYTNMEFGATDYLSLRNNAEVLKAASVIPEPIHYVHRRINIPREGWVWRGGFQYHPGLTTARFRYYSATNPGSGNGHFFIYFNDVLVYTATCNQGGLVTIDIAITGLGYIEQEIVSVYIVQRDDVGSTGDVFKNTVYVLDAYVFPISGILTTAWPGVPSFGSISASNLNQLVNAENWLVTRVKLIPNTLSMSMFKWQGTDNPVGGSGTYFTMRAVNGNTHLYGQVYYVCNVDVGYIRIETGATTWEYGPYTKGSAQMVEIDIDLIAAGLLIDTDYLTQVRERIATPDSGDPKLRKNSRMTYRRLFMGAPTHSIAAGATTRAMLESLTFSTLQTDLNTIATQLAAVKARIDANPLAFNRGHMFRNRMVRGTEEMEYWEKEQIGCMIRRGALLWVKGQGLKIAYGAINVKITADNEKWDYSFEHEVELTPSDQVRQQYFFLDSFPGLYPGQNYWIIGKDIHYAAEHLIY
jgi:hypothetical protein